MNSDSHFLEAIQIAPNDTVPRLIYADWLEGRGDPRAEMIRIEEELRSLPVFSDRFWQLKPRRYELLQKLPTDWLEKMRYGTDSQPLLCHGLPRGSKRRWRLIREYVQQWYYHNDAMYPDVGGHPSRIAKTEARLGRTLPPSLKEWIAFAHDYSPDGKPEGKMVISDYYDMNEVVNHLTISLFLHHAGGLYSAVRIADLACSDPPVYEMDQEGWGDPYERRESESLTEYILRYAIERSPRADGSFNKYATKTPALSQLLLNSFPSHCELGHSEIFEGANVLIHWDNDPEKVHYFNLEVAVYKPLPAAFIPSFLRDLPDHW